MLDGAARASCEQQHRCMRNRERERKSEGRQQLRNLSSELGRESAVRTAEAVDSSACGEISSGARVKLGLARWRTRETGRGGHLGLLIGAPGVGIT